MEDRQLAQAIKHFLETLKEVKEAGFGEVSLKVSVQKYQTTSYAIGRTQTGLFSQIDESSGKS